MLNRKTEYARNGDVSIAKNIVSAQPEIRYVDSDGVNIAYTVVGDGPTTCSRSQASSRTSR